MLINTDRMHSSTHTRHYGATMSTEQTIEVITDADYNVPNTPYKIVRN